MGTYIVKKMEIDLDREWKIEPGTETETESEVKVTLEQTERQKGTEKKKLNDG